MTVLRVIARPMLASVFVYGGVNALRKTRTMALKAEGTSRAVTKAVETVAPGLPVPTGPEALVRANAIVHLGAGFALATGTYPRLAATVLAASLGPTTLVGHRFWEETDPVVRTNQKIHFSKNVAIAGGLLLSTLDPDPHKRSWFGRLRDWRTKRKAKKAEAGS